MTRTRIIAFIITGLGQGGAETQLSRVAVGLKARGWGVHVLTLMRENVFEQGLRGAGVPVETLDMQRGSASARDLVRAVGFLRRVRADVVCGFLRHGNWMARVAGRAAGVRKIVVSLRSAVVGEPRLERLERALNLVDPAVVTTANSRQAAERLVARHIVTPRRVVVIPNCIDVADYTRDDSVRGAVRADLGVNDDDFFWLAVGNLTVHKDYPTLARAFGRVVAAGTPCQLAIVGGGAPSPELSELLAAPELVDRIQLLGRRTDVADLWAAADAGVMSSMSEGFPNAAIEGLAAGKAMVSTAAGALPDIVEDGISGFVVPVRNAEELGASMLRMMALDESRRRAMGRAGQQAVSRRYGVERIVNQWDSLFSWMVGAEAESPSLAAV